MTKSIFFAALVAGALAACAQSPAPPTTPGDTAGASPASGFLSYCGPTWSVRKQGYVQIPCSPGS